ncbi:MAG: S8 family peptidase [Chitinophagales bacterium]
MGKNRYTVLLLLLISDFIFAQANTGKYIVYFKDKPVDKNVERLFSKEAIDYRRKFNIHFDERDFPVDIDYIEKLKNERAIIVNSSNWLNASLISIDENKITKIQQLPFISSVIKIERTNVAGIASIENTNECEEINDLQDFEDNYGSSFPQAKLLNGQYLHEQGYNGENMTIAVCDNGFYQANINSAFSHIFSQNRLLGTYSYVHGDSSVYNLVDGKHGSDCFSFIGGLKDNQYIGAAIKSNFYLFQTENDNNGIERLQEELNLAIALERCSQLGVKVVSISLGYNTFDVASENHDTSDMRKNNTPGAKAANIASSKGILVCVAAGNTGSSPWKYITTPSDADSAFCIASVNSNGVVAASSGYGLPNDARIKPNVAAVGVSPYLINTSGQVGQFGSGTSYATPQIAGFATCLWQAFPSKTNWEIKTAIEQSSSQYLTPDKRIGYGIPDFQKAFQILSDATFVSDKKLENELLIFPNPFQNTITFSTKTNLHIESINMLNSVGQLIFAVNAPTENTITFNDLPKGMYLLQVATNRGILIKKLIKE